MEYRSGHFQFDVSAPANDNPCNVHWLQRPAPDFSNLLLDAGEFHFKSGPIWSPVLVWQRGPDASELATAPIERGEAVASTAVKSENAEALNGDVHGFKRSWEVVTSSGSGGSGLRQFQFMAVLVALDAAQSGLLNADPYTGMTTSMAGTISVADNGGAGITWLGAHSLVSIDRDVVTSAAASPSDTSTRASVATAPLEAAVDRAVGHDGASIFVPDSASGFVAAAAVRAVGSSTSPALLASAAGSTQIGGDGDDLLIGGAGDDALFGGAGNDTLIGGDGNDQLDGGAGADVMVGGDGDDTYVVDDAADKVIEQDGAGDDTVVVETATLGEFSLVDAAHVENLETRGDGDFEGSGNDFDNVIIGAGGHDTLSGAAGDDTIDGGDGDDQLDGGTGADVMDGGDGDDTYVVDDMADVVIEQDGAGDDTVVVETATLGEFSLVDAAHVENLEARGDGDFEGIGNALDNRIIGSGGDDSLCGAGGDDTLVGGDGDDLIHGGTGADVMAGGDGDDTYVVDDAADLVIEQSDAGKDMVVVDTTVLSTYSIAGLDGVEELEGRGDEDFSGTGNDRDNTITSGSGDDTLIGGAGDDVLCGNGGDDRLDGGSGADTLVGGDGDDTYFVDDVADVVVEIHDAGHDVVQTTLEEFALNEGAEELVYTGSDSFVGMGNDADNVIHGGDAGDLLFGGSGNSGPGGGSSDVVADANAAFGTGNANDAIVLPQSAIDQSAVHEGVDAIIAGGRRNDVLNGNHNGNDTIDGGRGNDTIDGGTGDDVLIGGLGNDTFIFKERFGSDIIADFGADGGNDSLHFDADVEDLQNWFDAHVAQVGHDVVISITENDQVKLLGVDRSSLSLQDHFVFL